LTVTALDWSPSPAWSPSPRIALVQVAERSVSAVMQIRIHNLLHKFARLLRNKQPAFCKSIFSELSFISNGDCARGERVSIPFVVGAARHRGGCVCGWRYRSP
jgi:hypothetical protein